MFWRKDTTEELEELRRFVEGMKRGQTPATNDSLLETLRQIHDRREAPAAGHDHRRMLLERLRREARVRAGERVQDAIRVPDFAPSPSPRRFLQWALAASVAVHAAVGGYALTHMQFDRIFSGDAAAASAPASEPERVVRFWVPPIVNRQVGPAERPTTAPESSVRESASGRDLAGVVGRSGASLVPAVSSAPVGPPVAPGGGVPIVAGYSPSGLDGQADRNLPDDVGPALAGPPSADAPERPFSNVGGVNMERNAITETYDTKPRPLNRPTPQYTTKALEYHIKGTVVVSAVIKADGSISEMKVTRSLGYGLDEAAMDAVRRIRFMPATRGGVPVTVRIEVPVEFGLR